jgi:hypothetical protein
MTGEKQSILPHHAVYELLTHNHFFNQWSGFNQEHTRFVVAAARSIRSRHKNIPLKFDVSEDTFCVKCPKRTGGPISAYSMLLGGKICQSNPQNEGRVLKVLEEVLGKPAINMHIRDLHICLSVKDQRKLFSSLIVPDE